MNSCPIDYYCFCIDSLSTPLWEDFNTNQNDSEFRKNLIQDVENSTKLNKCLFYVKDKNAFFSNGKEVNIKGKVIFPRCAIFESEFLLSKIERAEATSICSMADKKKISSWPKYIQPFHHEVIETTKEEFCSNFEKYKEKFGRVFFKTKHKGFACEVLDISKKTFLGSFLDSDTQLEDENQPISPLEIRVFTTREKNGKINFNDTRFGFMDDKTEVFAEKFIEIKKNNKHLGCPEEYRCFVLDGKLANISHYFCQEQKVDKKLVEFAKKIVSILPKEFPKYFVLDICKFNNDGKTAFDIIEFNSIEASGYAQGNTIMSMEKIDKNCDISELEDSIE